MCGRIAARAISGVGVLKAFRDVTASKGTTKFLGQTKSVGFLVKVIFFLSFTSRLEEIENSACAQNVFMVWFGGQTGEVLDESERSIRRRNFSRSPSL